MFNLRITNHIYRGYYESNVCYHLIMCYFGNNVRTDADTRSLLQNYC